ncbi:MAG: glycoside hydrolase family 88/105 protein [Bacteroidales bacterium]
MNKPIAVITLILSLLSFGGKAQERVVSTLLPMSERMVYSEIIRNPESWQTDFRKKPKWTYTNGLEMHSILDVADRYGNIEFFEYAESYADLMVQEDGTISTYRVDEYNIDHLAPGKILFELYEKTKKEKYLKALRLLRSQLDNHPRTKEGGFWHKKVYPNQMWLDGLYMGAPFYAQCASYFNEPSKYQDVINQFILVGKGTWDPKSKLYRHAFDYSKEMFWADKQTGQSSHVWGRAMGWYAMALVDALDFIPQDEPNRKQMLDILENIAKGLVKYQDKKSGLYYQVMELPGKEGNYLEGTCSAMFAYSVLKAVRKGYLPSKYRKLGESIYNGIVENLIKVDQNGIVSLTQCCEVAGLGGKSMRDGSYDYYLSEPIRDNDPKGVGPFIWASLEMESLYPRK